jgi:hypothetical protein
MVDLPLPASGATEDAKATRGYVPASDKWIELGVSQRPATSPRSRSASDRLHADLLDGAVASPAAEAARDAKPRQSRRKVRGPKQS